MKWKGQSNYPLEKHCVQQPTAYVSLVSCADHVAYQFPNEHSRVGYLLDSIQNNDPGLQAAMAQIIASMGADGLKSDFETTVAYILPYCPVTKRRTSSTICGLG